MIERRKVPPTQTPEERKQLRNREGLWAGIISAAILTQLIGVIFKKPWLMLSHHIGDRIHQGVAALAFMLIFWLVWHWGIGRKLEPGYMDIVFIGLGVAYWWIAYKHPLPW